MIEDGSGNLLTADVQALVNTVNTVGVMGKGIALQFKRAYPANTAHMGILLHRGGERQGKRLVLLPLAGTAVRSRARSSPLQGRVGAGEPLRTLNPDGNLPTFQLTEPTSRSASGRR